MVLRGQNLPFTHSVINSEVKKDYLIRLPHLFLGDLLAVVRCSLALKAPEKHDTTGSNVWPFKMF
jgi:hypothetical protein